MPPINRNKRFSKAAQNSPFGASLAAGIEDPSKLQNAIEFIEGPNGIGIVLRPVQRVVVKSIFGVRRITISGLNMARSQQNGGG